MTITASITHRYPATCRVGRRGYLPHGLREWVLTLVLGALASVAVVAVVEWTSLALAGR